MPFKNKIRLFDKADIHYCAKNAAYDTYKELIRSHTMMYIYSGELIVHTTGEDHTFSAGECVFLKKGSYVATTIQPKEDEKFSAVYIRLKKCFLKDFIKETVIKPEYNDLSMLPGNVSRVNNTPDIESLFISFLPYIKQNVQPTPAITNLKMKAGIFTLLNMQAGYYSILFDFGQKWTFQWINLL